MIALCAASVILVICVLLSKQVARYPGCFYAFAAALVCIYVYGLIYGFPLQLWHLLIVLMQRGLLAFVFFAAVMFVGALPKDSSLRRTMSPIRGELSIMAAVFSIGHIGYYAYIFARQIPGLALGTPKSLSFMVAVVLVALLVVLALTSLRYVRRRMNALVWKRIQRFAYVFWILIYVHIAFIFMLSLVAATQDVWLRFVGYTIVFGSYVALRVRRYLLDRAGCR